MRRVGGAASLVVTLAAAASADSPVLRYVPRHEELKYTFGGVAPTHRIQPGTRVFADLTAGSPAVVVARAGRPAGMLTRSDLLEYLAHRRNGV